MSHQLLLQALLLGGQEQVGRHHFRVHVIVHGQIGADVECRRCEHLLRQSVHRTTGVHVHILVRGKRVTGESSSHCSLRNTLSSPVRTVGISTVVLVLLMMGRDRSRFGSSPQPRQQMRAAGAWSLERCRRLRLIDGRDVRRWHTQSLDMRAFSARRKAGTGDAKGAAVIERRVVSHLSKTASVHTHGRNGI